MLQCKVGTTIINCFDGKYDKHQLKNWSSRNMLMCPECNRPYEYCHGEIIHPYFRHKEKSLTCTNIYSESESDEHIKGKLHLYSWLLKLQEDNIIENVKLEAYIPVTKQRPDLYFEQCGQRCVIEFQCTPISSEYLKRRELYKLADIQDIWILGIKKYNLNVCDRKGSHSQYFKSIEKYADGYLDAFTGFFYLPKRVTRTLMPYNLVKLEDYQGYLSKELILRNCKLSLCESITNKYIMQEKCLLQEYKRRVARKERLLRLRLSVVKKLEKTYEDFHDVTFTYRKGNGSSYEWAIAISYNKAKYYFFIKQSKVDFCELLKWFYKIESIDTDRSIRSNDLINFICQKLDLLFAGNI